MEKLSHKKITDIIIGINEIEQGDIISIIEKDGGLVNHVFEVKTKKGLMYVKQFLDGLKSEIFKDLEKPPKDRAEKSYNASEKMRGVLGDSDFIPKIYKYSKKEGYIVMEGFGNVSPVFDNIKKGVFSEIVLKNIAENIAEIHQETFSDNNEEYELYNSEWLDLKLKYQYYEMSQYFVDKNTRKKFEDLVRDYKNRRMSLVHGDLCSINLLVNEKYEVFLIDFEDAHIGDPSFDLGYMISEYLIAAEFFSERKSEINSAIEVFLDTYFSIFTKISRKKMEKNIAFHSSSLMLYRTFGLAKDTFTAYIEDVKVKENIRKKAESIMKNEIII